MSLNGAPLVYVFADVHGLPRQRELLEAVVGLPVIEIEPHLPHHRHGAVKYDAGPLIYSLNLSSPGKFRRERSDALVTVLAVDAAADLPAKLREYGLIAPREDGVLFTDPSGHHYLLTRAAAEARGPRSRPVVRELRLVVDDLGESIRFYGDRLELDLRERSRRVARFATGTVDLVVAQGSAAADGRELDRRTCLLVFYTPDVEDARRELELRGVDFGNRRGAFSEIGGTARFDDPSGHRFCLYQPSAESLTWESGPKVQELAAGAAAR